MRSFMMMIGSKWQSDIMYWMVAEVRNFMTIGSKWQSVNIYRLEAKVRSFMMTIWLEWQSVIIYWLVALSFFRVMAEVKSFMIRSK